MTGKAIANLEKQYHGSGYAKFKTELAEAVIASLAPIRVKYAELAKNKTNVLKVLQEGRKKAEKTAEATMKDVRKKIGLLEV